MDVGWPLVVVMASYNPVPTKAALEDIFYDDSYQYAVKVYADIDDYSVARCHCEVHQDQSGRFVQTTSV